MSQALMNNFFPFVQKNDIMIRARVFNGNQKVNVEGCKQIMKHVLKVRGARQETRRKTSL